VSLQTTYYMFLYNIVQLLPGMPLTAGQIT